MKKNNLPPDIQVVFVFQGGGALGSYQVGVFKGLSEAGYEPQWLAGTSIGAINAAIIAGNEPSKRVDKLLEFWDIITRITPNFSENVYIRQFEKIWSSNLTLLYGQPGFFSPRFPNPWFIVNAKPNEISYYDTSELRGTLERVIDFDLINKAQTRLSLCSVEVRTGRHIYFDNTKQKIGPEHIMASGALPPGFPAVEIEGKMYWDGGISSNTPVTHVIRKSSGHNNILCFMAHLFDSYGLLPKNLDEVCKRKKDVEYSSQYHRSLLSQQEIHQLRNSIKKLSRLIPKNMRNKPEILEILEHSKITTTRLVRFHYRGQETDRSSKDYEFSKKSILQHFQVGYQDALRGLEKSPWLEPVPPEMAIALHDIAEIFIEGSTTNE